MGTRTELIPTSSLQCSGNLGISIYFWFRDKILIKDKPKGKGIPSLRMIDSIGKNGQKIITIFCVPHQKKKLKNYFSVFFTHMSLFPFPFLPNIWRKRYLFFTLHFFFFFYRNFPSFIYSAFLSSLYFPLFLHQLLVNYHNIICYPTNTIYFGFLALNRKKVIRARNNILLGGS